MQETVVILDQASGYLQIDMLEAYKSRYSKRVIIAGTIVERSTSLSKDIVWHKISPYKRETKLKRVVSWLSASISMFFIVALKYRKAHIVAITNPPFSVFIPWLLGCSYDIVIYDLYPDALVHYNYLSRKNLIYGIWSYMNKAVFQKAKRIYTLTEGMKKLASNYSHSSTEIKVVPLWSSSSDFENVEKDDNIILKQTGALGKFVLVYSGNLGVTHPIEKLIYIAEKLDPEKFSIIIIGGGAKKKMLEKLVENKKLRNVHLLPWQPVEFLSHNLQAADLSVVTLDAEASDLSIPSKTFNILSIGNPILGICSKSSGLADLLEKYNCGIVSAGDDLDYVVENIIKLQRSQDLLGQYRMNSQKASEMFTKKNAESFID